MSGLKYIRAGITDNLSDFAFIPPSVVGHLSRRLRGDAHPRSVLIESWRAAYDSGYVIDEGDKISFQVMAEDAQGEGASLSQDKLLATIKRNTKEGADQEWAVAYAGPDTYHKLDILEDDMASPRDIQEFAFIPWDKVLAELSSRAREEPWGFDDEDGYSVLRSYVTYTYQRVAIQNKVAINEAKRLAAFNTGLVTPTFDDLFMCFRPNHKTYPAWAYDGVCVAGERGLGKRLVDSFAETPIRASYFEDVRDLVFDSAQRLYVDEEHIVVDNIDRLPLGFLKRQFYDYAEALRLVEQIEQIEGYKQEPYERIREILRNETSLLLRLKERVGDAVKVARKRTEWNYRTAVPCYYPRANEMSLLLPLCLETPNKPDVALVVSLSESGAYQGETILTMRQAYLDARLICRPENDWLIVQ